VPKTGSGIWLNHQQSSTLHNLMIASELRGDGIHVWN